MSRSRRPRPSYLKNDREFERKFSDAQKRSAKRHVQSGHVESVPVRNERRVCNGWAR